MDRRRFLAAVVGWGVIGAARAEDGSVKGKLLVANRGMLDPNFKNTVVLMIEHDQRGAFGLVINRTHGAGRLAVLLRALGIEADGAAGEVRVRYGGPVAPNNGFVVHSPDYAKPDTRAIGEGVALTGGRDILHDIAKGTGPHRYLIALGYSGWAPGQLEAEIEAGGWAIALADPAIVFDEDDDAKWRRAIARVPREL